MKNVILITTAILLAFAGCKDEQVADIKGALVTKSNKDINYQALYGELSDDTATPGSSTSAPEAEEDAWVGSNATGEKSEGLNLLEDEDGATTIRATFMFAFAGGHPGADFPGIPGGSPSISSIDSGAKAAARFVKWLKAQGSGDGALLPDIEEKSNDIPAEPSTATKGSTYAATFHAPKVAVSYTKDGKKTSGYVAFEIKVMLGSVGAQTSTGSSFLDDVGEAYLKDHIVSYNGHSWSPEEHRLITSKISSLKGTGGGRTTPGLTLTNGCMTEGLELSLIGSLSGVDPYNSAGKEILEDTVLLSNDNSHLSNFGYFATQNALLLESLINGRSLRETVEKLTVSKPSNESYDEYLGRVYRKPSLPGSRTNVVLVVYDRSVAGEELSPQTIGPAGVAPGLQPGAHQPGYQPYGEPAPGGGVIY